MIAASARTSGISAPTSLSLNFGSSASRSAAATRARAAWTRRALEVAAAEVGLFFLRVSFGFGALDPRGVDVVDWVDVWATASTGSPTAASVANAQISRTILKSRAGVTGKPLGNNLLRNVSAL